MSNLPNNSQIILYQTEDGQTRLEVRLRTRPYGFRKR